LPQSEGGKGKGEGERLPLSFLPGVEGKKMKRRGEEEGRGRKHPLPTLPNRGKKETGNYKKEEKGEKGEKLNRGLTPFYSIFVLERRERGRVWKLFLLFLFDGVGGGEEGRGKAFRSLLFF